MSTTATPRTSTSTTTDGLPAAQPNRTTTSGSGSGGLSDLAARGGSGGEGIDPLLDVVGDPGRDDPTCPVPARRGLDPARPRYLATVNADPVTGLVEGHLTVQFTPDLPIDRVELRLWANSPRIAAVGGHIEVASPTADGQPAPLEQRDATSVAVVLPTLLPAGETTTVGVDYRLEIPAPSGDRVSREADALRLGSFLPLVPWEPGGRGWDLDPPTSGFAEAATSPAADWDVTVNVPDGYRVLGSGRSSDGTRWLAAGARDVAFTIGRFTVVQATAAAPQPVAVTVGVAESLAGTEDATAYATEAVTALEAFAARFGAYPWRQLTMAVSGDLAGGIEFPGHVMLGPGTIGRTNVHEVAHQWFYGLVGNNQARDPVLDEGLASYAELSQQGLLETARDWVPPPEAVSQANRSMEFWEQHLDAYYLGVYVQGARALAALGATADVDCALRRYVAAEAFAIATPAPLLAALTSVFPDASAVLVPFGVG